MVGQEAYIDMEPSILVEHNSGVKNGAPPGEHIKCPRGRNMPISS